MLRRILRVLLGFALACLAAAIAMVVFADIQELKGLNAADAELLLATTGERILFTAMLGALFAAPIAFVGIVIGEFRRIDSWTYYTLLALAIAFVGFLSWSIEEQSGDPTIVNNYAMTAFLTAGFVGGLFYWLFSGRAAGMPYSRRDFDFVRTPEKEAQENGKAAKKVAEKTGEALKDGAEPVESSTASKGETVKDTLSEALKAAAEEPKSTEAATQSTTKGDQVAATPAAKPKPRETQAGSTNPASGAKPAAAKVADALKAQGASSSASVAKPSEAAKAAADVKKATTSVPPTTAKPKKS